MGCRLGENDLVDLTLIADTETGPKTGSICLLARAFLATMIDCNFDEQQLQLQLPLTAATATTATFPLDATLTM